MDKRLKEQLKGRWVQTLLSPDNNTDKVSIIIRNEAGDHSTEISTKALFNIPFGSIVAIDSTTDSIQCLTPNRSGKLHFSNRTLDPKRRQNIQIRSQVIEGIRDYFIRQKFLEVETPLLVPCPGMETHIRPFKLTTGAYLPTSPEFAMKRLLVGGLEKIFQISQAFRYEPFSKTHTPQFTMLEFYRAYEKLESILNDTEEMFAEVARKIFGSTEFVFQGQPISLKTPWKRYTVLEAMKKWADVDLRQCRTTEAMKAACLQHGLTVGAQDTWDDLFFRIWLNQVEPRFPKDHAIFITDFPGSQSALAEKYADENGMIWARRFEFYIHGLEMGNAFQELTNPVEQRARFIEDMNLREQIYGARFEKTPLDEEFLSALEEGMPPSSGIAIGVDRMILLFCDEESISKTHWLDPYPGIDQPSVL